MTAPAPISHGIRARWGATEDEARPDAIAKRHALGLRTARENIADLCRSRIISGIRRLRRGGAALAPARSRISSSTRRPTAS